MSQVDRPLQSAERAARLLLAAEKNVRQALRQVVKIDAEDPAVIALCNHQDKLVAIRGSLVLIAEQFSEPVAIVAKAPKRKRRTKSAADPSSPSSEGLPPDARNPLEPDRGPLAR